MRRKALPLAALLALAASPARAEPLTVAVAANALPAMQELREGFRKGTGVDLALVSGSSGKFSAQIRAGAPFDLLLSADAEYPARLHEDGWADAPVVYARGRLILWTVKPGLDLSKGLAGLARERLGTLAVADPKVAPYGRAALEALDRAGLLGALESKLVFGESIGQVNQFVASGAADVGLTAKSAAFAPRTRGLGRWSEVPAELHAPIEQAFAVLKHGRERNPKAAAKLAEFLVSPEARKVWDRFGYD